MNLADLRPKPSSFKLENHKQVFNLNPLNLSDEVWLDETFGAERVAEIFATLDIKEIVKIAYRVLTHESKSSLKAQEITIIDGEGNESTGELGGINLLMSMISGNKDKLAVINSLLEVIGASRPEADKKKAVKKRKGMFKK